MKRFLKAIVAAYLQYATRLLLWRRPPLLIAISGLRGKSLVKHAVARGLRQQGIANILVTREGYNTEFGLPLALLGITLGGRYNALVWFQVLLRTAVRVSFGAPLPRIVITEFGIAAKGDAAALLDICRPDILVVTTIEYSDFNPSATLDELAEEFTVLARGLKESAVRIVNGDNLYTRQITALDAVHTITYGEGTNSDVAATVQKDAVSGEIHFTVADKEYHTLQGRLGMYGQLASIAVVLALRKRGERYA